MLIQHQLVWQDADTRRIQSDVMNADELKLRRDRLEWSKHALGGHCAFLNFVLDLRKVTNLSEEAATEELLKWAMQGIPFQETIDAYICGGPPDILSNEISLDA